MQQVLLSCHNTKINFNMLSYVSEWWNAKLDVQLLSATCDGIQIQTHCLLTFMLLLTFTQQQQHSSERSNNENENMQESFTFISPFFYFMRFSHAEPKHSNSLTFKSPRIGWTFSKHSLKKLENFQVVSRVGAIAEWRQFVLKNRKPFTIW